MEESPEILCDSAENGLETNKDSEDSGTKRKADDDCSDEVCSSKKLASAAINEEKKSSNLRKNIRDVIDENQLDSITIAAQREESERLARVNEQQKTIREHQRQTAAIRQNARTQSKVLSLLQSGSTFAKIAEVTTSLTPNDDSVQTESITDKKDDDLEPETIQKESKLELVPESVEKRDPCEIVTIDDSSDDDCILLSDEEIEDDSIEEDDANNSGMHVKDIYNVPDELGRVVVNIGHPDGEEDIYVAPQVAKTIKPHQIGGVRFLFDNIIESTNRFKSSSGFGCILAHSMGLGKTLQVVCFCDLFLRHTESKTILCVMPINTIQNWLSEFNMWTPRYSDNEENVRPRTFDVFALNDQQKTLSARAKVIKRWSSEGGVLLIGYELFRLLALKLSTSRRRRGNKGADKNGVSDSSSYNKNLYDDIQKALVKPGPDLVICDEGHRIKNSNAGISVALKQIKTRRRIVLTGYPLQNNLLEYWCMVDFVRPNYLGSRTEFCNMFERPIQNGQCIDSTPGDIKLMRYRAHVLHSLLVGFVQRRSHAVLQESLPEKKEYVILTKMTKFQRELYKRFMTNVVISKVCPNPLKAFAVCCKIWNHPDVLYNFLKKRQADLDLEIDEVVNENQTSVNPEKTSQSDSSVPVNTNNIKSSETHIEEKKSEILSSSSTVTSSGIKSDALNCSAKGTFFGEDYLQQYGSNENEYWKYSNSYDPCGSIQYPSTPSYVGTVKETNPTKNIEENGNSTEVVDLDTQEIKTVSTYVNLNKHHFMEPNKDNTKNNTTETSMNSANNADPEKLKAEISDDKEDIKVKHEDEGVPYDWAKELMINYTPGLISNSPKMEIVFYILKESIEMGDRILLFSQSLLTLNLIEQFLDTNNIPTTNLRWSKGLSYFRLDGSTSAQEREKLVNEFNSNADVKLFLISTRAGSLGINLIGANRVIIFDASWNPCHDTQAVYRVYRFGQKKPCFIYRIVMDRCLEKKIYDRQIKKQGMSNRVVDECNPESHLSIKDVSNLCHNNESDLDDDKEGSFTQTNEHYGDNVVHKIVKLYKNFLSKEPFHHESLLLDRKERKLSQAEKRLAHRGYEAEKKSISQKTSINTVQYRMARTDGTFPTKPTASVRPMQNSKNTYRSTRWIPAEVWQRQGMTAQEMTLPLDVVIPTNSSDKTNIILKAGQRVMVLKSTKGIYMQLESGKIIAIRTASKTNETTTTNNENKFEKGEVIDITADADVNTESRNSDKNDENKDTEENVDNLVEGKNEIPENNGSSSLPTEEIVTKIDTGVTDMSQKNVMPDEIVSPQKWPQNSKILDKVNDNWPVSPKEQSLDTSQIQTAESSFNKDYWMSAPQNFPEKSLANNNFSINNITYNGSMKNSNPTIKKSNDYLERNGQKGFSHIEATTQINESQELNTSGHSERKQKDTSEVGGDYSMQNSASFPSFINRETSKNYDQALFNKQLPPNFFKSPLYATHSNAQRYPYNSTQSTVQNCVPQMSEPNNTNSSYISESNYNNYPMNFYDNYNTNTFVEQTHENHRPYIEYPNYGPYSNMSYQQNYTNPGGDQNASISPSPTASNFKPYYAWPNISMPPAPSSNICTANFTNPNYSNGNDANRWPHQ